MKKLATKLLEKDVKKKFSEVLLYIVFFTLVGISMFNALVKSEENWNPPVAKAATQQPGTDDGIHYEYRD